MTGEIHIQSNRGRRSPYQKKEVLFLMGCGGSERIFGKFWKQMFKALDLFAHHFESVVIQRTWDGAHSPDSLHYQGRALDVRLPNQDWNWIRQTLEDIRKDLGKDYRVILRPTHIHVEFNPQVR